MRFEIIYAAIVLAYLSCTNADTKSEYRFTVRRLSSTRNAQKTSALRRSAVGA